MVEKVTEDLGVDEALKWVEFGCWTALSLMPFLYLVNGPAVSTDQYVVRTVLIVVAAAGAIGLRIWNWRTARRTNSA